VVHPGEHHAMLFSREGIMGVQLLEPDSSMTMLMDLAKPPDMDMP
jgi:hypothetical protein